MRSSNALGAAWSTCGSICCSSCDPLRQLACRRGLQSRARRCGRQEFSRLRVFHGWLTAAIALPFTDHMSDVTHSHSLALAIVCLLAVTTRLSLLAMPRRGKR